jgi:hypothetical protein
MNSQTEDKACCPHLFRGSLPDDVPMVEPVAIKSTIADFDANRLEVMLVEPGDEPGFCITALVFLNKARDEGYYFRGLVDADGYHRMFPNAMSVVDALRSIADQSTVELDIFATGDGLRMHGDPKGFFQQLEDNDFHWLKNDAPKSLNASCIPAGHYCGDCPYSQYMDSKPEQQYGYCAYLDLGDWMVKLGFSHLWDGLKECKINSD